MIKNKIISSLELLSLSKPRVTLILKDLIDNLIYLSTLDYCENLLQFKNLYLTLKKQNISDISSYISEHIVDYNIQISSKTPTTANIILFFQSGFIVDKLSIYSLIL